jgi:hypothetical protein
MESSQDPGDDNEVEKPLFFTFDLKDTPDIQYLRFKEPILATDIEIKIADVYKGLKYKDTAISEIVFFVNQDE